MENFLFEKNIRLKNYNLEINQLKNSIEKKIKKKSLLKIFNSNFKLDVVLPTSLASLHTTLGVTAMSACSFIEASWRGGP